MARQFDLSQSTVNEVNRLCMAIIGKAVDDYVETIVKDKNHGKINGKLVGNIREDIEGFFNSDYFNLLTSCMGLFDTMDVDTLIALCNQKGNYCKWRKEQKCSTCSKKNCIHRKGKYFDAEQVCEKDKF